MRWVSQAVAVAGLTITGTPDSSAGRGLLPQAPGREVEGVDEQRHAARRHLHVLRLERRLLAQLDGVAVAQRARVAQRLAPSSRTWPSVKMPPSMSTAESFFTVPQLAVAIS